MSTLVLRCGTAPVPITLAALTAVTGSARPTGAELDEEVLPVLDADALPRLIVLGDDAALAAVLTHLLRIERLGVAIGYVPVDRSPAARNYGIGTGSAAAKLALDGAPAPTPLIRDDTGTVLVGRAVVTGPDGGPLTGEAYCDDTRVLNVDAEVNALRIEPTAEPPGLVVPVRRRFRRRRLRVPGRAVQVGTPGALVTRDGVPDDRVVRRVSIYCHHEPWQLIR